MTLSIDEAYLPATLTAPLMTDEEFERFCAQYPDHLIEMSADGEILIMPPNHSLTGMRSGKVFFQLELWALHDGRGATGDASTGFVLPNGARRSPDAAWTARSRVNFLSPQEREGYWHLCPDFVIELRSKTDRLRNLRAKMVEWTSNGAQLAWLIDPEREAVEIYRPGREPEILNDVLSVSGEGPVEGFTLNLEPVWNPL